MIDYLCPTTRQHTCRGAVQSPILVLSVVVVALLASCTILDLVDSRVRPVHRDLRVVVCLCRVCAATA